MMQVLRLAGRNPEEFVWARLKQYQNIDFCAGQILRYHRLPAQRWQDQARKQAEQIRYCLEQAREYVQAAQTVSLATRPVLLYYATMSLALAEILFKQSAESRLAKLREKHPAHGLALKMAGDPRPTNDLAVAASMLVAKGQVDGGGRPVGTFSVWHRSAREPSIAGNRVIHGEGGTSTGPVVLFGSSGADLPPFPKAGMSLMQCLRALPYMDQTLVHFGDMGHLIRATVSYDHYPLNPALDKTTIITHPGHPENFKRFYEAFKIPGWMVNFIDVHEFPSGGFSCKIYRSADTNFSIPQAFSISDKECCFPLGIDHINEFGCLYVAMHICGNFARYYPDIWVKHIERSSSLALVIDELCKHAFERLPLLTYGELHRTLFIR